jgi:hypothetical protein
LHLFPPNTCHRTAEAEIEWNSKGIDELFRVARMLRKLWSEHPAQNFLAGALGTRRFEKADGFIKQNQMQHTRLFLSEVVAEPLFVLILRADWCRLPITK